MKKLSIGLMVLSIVAIGMIYRYGVAASGSSVCSTVSDKFECNADWASIQDYYKKCSNSCVTKEQWYRQCDDDRFICESECEFLLDEGKTRADVNKCKKLCAQKAEARKKSYRNKSQCQSACRKEYEKRVKAFNDRWKKR